jgi:hypothetical protein
VRLLNLALLALAALLFLQLPLAAAFEEGVPPRVAVEHPDTVERPDAAIPQETPVKPVVEVPSRRPSLFVTCVTECFLDYLRQELSYFDFVRDRFLSDFVILVVRQPAENSGERMTVRLTRSKGQPHELEETILLPAGATIEQTRNEEAQAILRLLIQSLAGTAHARAFSLSVPKRSAAALSEQGDPWDYWVFSPELTASGEASRGSLFARGEVGLNVRRSTEKSKVRLLGNYGRAFSGFRFEDGEWVSGDIYDWKARGLYGWSVSDRVSIGAVVQGNGSQYENLSGHIHGAPMLEVNLFPYSENARRAIRFAYQAGPWQNFYFEPNVAGKTEELRAYHAVSLVIDVNQAWGSVQWIGQFNQFLDDPQLFRVSSGAIVSLRLAEGLALNFSGQGAFVHDLIQLRGRPLTDDELVLYTAQQATDFMVTWESSISYTFGSIHNSIVNPRFGRIDLEED